MEETNAICLRNISKVYENNVKAISNLNLDIKQGELIAITGPHDSGKSTLLRLIAGVEEVSDGEIYLNGKFSNNLSTKDREVALSFQTASLYSSMTVYENLAYGLKSFHLSKEETDKRVRYAAKVLQLVPYLEARPKTLTEGQCQRVALGRAIVRNPKIYLMDDSLAGLDRSLAIQMRSEIIKIHNDLGMTTIYATTNQADALTISTKVVVMRLGHIEQVSTPLDIYTHPSNLFVATFFGSPTLNVMKGIYENGTITLSSGEKIALEKEFIEAHDSFYKNEIENNKKEIETLKEKNLLEEVEKLYSLNDKYEHALTEKHDIIFAIRPEDVVLGDRFSVRIVSSDLAGDNNFIHADFAGTDLVAKISSKENVKVGDEVKLSFNVSKAHIFDSSTEKTIY